MGLLRQPVVVAADRVGTILVLELGNLRVQAFDIFGNPVAYFSARTAPFLALTQSTASSVFLDMKADAEGLLYVLSYEGDGFAPADYHLDIYDAQTGGFVCRTAGIAAARMALDVWRNVYTLNYEYYLGPAGRPEPTVSEWIPSA